MSEQQIDTILTQLRELMVGDELDDETFTRMRAASTALRNWRKEGGGGPLPHAAELRAWGVDLPAVTQEAEEDAFAAHEWPDHPEAAVAEPEMEAAADEEAQPDEPLDPLQAPFEAAMALLEGGRYHAALTALAEIKDAAGSRLRAQVIRREAEAREKLREQTQPLIEKALTHARKQPNDFRNQISLWDKVLEVDPDNETADEALQNLRQQQAEAETQRKIDTLRQTAAEAKKANQHTQLVRLLAEAEELQTVNELLALQPKLDALVQEITDYRDEVRFELGQISTLMLVQDADGTYRSAYKRARESLGQVSELFDDTGVLGEAGKSYQPNEFLKLIRQKLLAGLHEIALQRKATADAQKDAAPALAQQKLAEAQAMLTDELLTPEDHEKLKPTLETIEKALHEVEQLIKQFDSAHQKVLDTKRAGIKPDETLQLFQEARAIFPTYPNIEQEIANAEDAVAAVEAGLVADALTTARRLKEKDQYDEAIQTLQAARQAALGKIPQPKPTSTLKQRLNEVDELEKEIVDAEGEYERMMETLRSIDGLVPAEPTGSISSSALVSARSLLQQFDQKQFDHPQTRKRWSRLINLQGVGESWEQGRDAFRLGNWDSAVELLQRVKDSDAPERNQAERMLNRAKAAQFVLKGQKADIDRNWQEAVRNYRQAEKLFNESPLTEMDEPTERLFQEAQTGLQRLKPLEKNDVEVRSAIQQAKGWLTEAEKQVQTRQTPLSRVEPVEEFSRAVQALLEVRKKDTTLTTELEEALQEGREAWRKAYLDGMRSARVVKDENILWLAVALGQELQDNDLLYETADKEIFREVQELFLDLELQRLQHQPPSQADLEQELQKLEQAGNRPQRVAKLKRDLELLLQDPETGSALIEENRRQRLAIAPVQSEQWQEEYRAAAENRVRHQLGRERQQGVQEALGYLHQQLQRSELYHSEGLLAELMHLSWEAGAWERALSLATALKFRSRLNGAELKSELWQELTKTAESLDAGETGMYAAGIERLKHLVREQPDDYTQFVKEQENWLVRWRVNNLVSEAARVARSNKQANVISAAQLYAEAYRLTPDDSLVQKGLQRLGQKLAAMLDTLLDGATHLAVRNNLSEVLRIAREQRTLLATIQEVGDLLGLNKEDHERIRETIIHLDDKIGTWQQVEQQLALADKKRSEALENPLPFRGELGGWSFDQPVAEVQKANSKAGKDSQLLALLRDEREQLEELDGRAQELNGELRAFLDALQEEIFEQVIERATKLETLWRDRQNDGFRGLERLVRPDHLFLKKRNIRTLAQHRQLAEQQKDNFNGWQEWANRCQQQYDAINSLWKGINKELDLLRLDKALEQIEEECKRVIEGCVTFGERYMDKPSVDPISRRAEKEKLRITQAMVDQINDERTGVKTKALALRQKVGRELDDFAKGPLRKLQSAMKQLEDDRARVGTRTGLFSLGKKITTIPEQRFENARHYLRECKGIDPWNEDIAQIENRLKLLEEQYRQG